MMTVTYKTINYICDEFTLVNMAWLRYKCNVYLSITCELMLSFHVNWYVVTYCIFVGFYIIYDLINDVIITQL